MLGIDLRRSPGTCLGVHRFYKKTEGQPDKLVEIAKLTQVWKKDASGWKLARVLSYDHKLTE